MELRESLGDTVPVDDHVKRLLEKARKEYDISVDPNSPTRKACLDAAVAMHGLNCGISSREIMMGRRIDGSSSEAFVLEGLWQIHSRESEDLRYFYLGINNSYLRE